MPGNRNDSGVLNALSIDVEDWFQVGAFEHCIDRADWDTRTERVVGNTERVLALLAAHDIRATFFTLGWEAERHPDLIRRIVAAGHELACHGYDHRRVFTLTPEAFRADLRKAKAILEQAGGVAVKGYRAPSFSIDARTPWAHPILAEEGFAYSSSVAPIVHDHYGWPQAPRFAFRPIASATFLELPVTTVHVAGRTLAAGGGGFFRLLPYAFSRWAVRRVNRRDGQGAIIYFHPWEIDAGQPHMDQAPLKSRLRHYTNIRVMEAKLARLMTDFRWGRVDALAAKLGKEAPCWPAA